MADDTNLLIRNSPGKSIGWGLSLRKAFILRHARFFLMAFPMVSKPGCDYAVPYVCGVVDIGAGLLSICSRGPTAIAP